MDRIHIFLSCLLAIPTGHLVAESFASGERNVPLIELYTSEGCSSCPPAEAWLSSLRDRGDLWKQFVPISFHVTYWDYLGWKDGLAEDAFTQRQRAYAASWNSGTVYTPGFVRNGLEWHRQKDLEPKNEERVGNLTVTISGDQAAITFEPIGKDSSSYEAHLATVASKIESRVRAGENSGRTLRHDFVAMSLQNSTLQSASDGKYTTVISIPKSDKKAAPEVGIVVWVTKANDLRPLQATGGLLQ